MDYQPLEQVFEVTPTGWTYGGEVVARLPDGRAVFVPFALPGETIRISLVEEKQRYARGRLIEVVHTSSDRIQPRCKHFTMCGGCQYQHISYENQLIAKQSVLVDQLKRIAEIAEPPVKNIQPSPSEWFYRNNIHFHPAPNGTLGFQKAGSRQIVPISECYLPDQAINSLWPQLQMEEIPGLNRIGIRLGIDDEIMLVFEGTDSQPFDFSVDIPLSAIYSGPGGDAVLSGDPYLWMEVGKQVFRVSPGSFFQVNTPMAQGMVEYLQKHLPLTSSSLLLDIYCGVGLFSAFLAPMVKEVIGVELSESACEDFAFNLDAFSTVSLYQGAAEKVLPSLNLKPDVVLVDPPRAGIDRFALDAILKMKPKTLAYVSCDPSTLARDAKRILKNDYELISVQPFDIFPQTYHIESISLFILK